MSRWTDHPLLSRRSATLLVRGILLVMVILAFAMLEPVVAASFVVVLGVLLLGVRYLKAKFYTPSRASWQVPLAGYVITFLLGVGLSLSNQDIRMAVELVGLVLFAVFTVLGCYYTAVAFYRYAHRAAGTGRKNAIAGLVCNLLLASLATAAAIGMYQSETRAVRASRVVSNPAAAASSSAPTPVWIDTDPACGATATADMDDCWALFAAVRSPELRIRGISTVFGNLAGHNTYLLEESLSFRIISSCIEAA